MTKPDAVGNATCPACRRRVGVRKDGRLKAHYPSTKEASKDTFARHCKEGAK